MNSSIPSTAVSERDEAEIVTVCVMLALSVNDTQQVLDTSATGRMLIIVCGLRDNIREFRLVRLPEPSSTCKWE